jgi:hypothetical protein
MKVLPTLALACAFFAPLSLTASAHAASPWDGTWNLNRAKSHLTGDSFTYTKLPNGMWHFAYGNIGYDFAPDGKSYPSFDPEHPVTTTANGDHALTIVTSFKGKPTSTIQETLSPDGQTLTDVTTGVHPDGSSYTTTVVSKRSGPGTDFFAKWVSTKEESNTKATFTLNTAADGSMTWNFPISKETATAKMDGTPAPITGPQVPAGVIITYKKVSARRLTFSVMFKDKPVGEGYDELSADGKTLEETSWVPGKMSEKTTSVYDKQ